MDNVSRLFGPNLSTGEKIAAKLGGNVETRAVRAVSGVSLTVRRGETLGLVGESGCGKSTLGRLIAGILPPTSGTILHGRRSGHGGRPQGHDPRTNRVSRSFCQPRSTHEGWRYGIGGSNRPWSDRPNPMRRDTSQIGLNGWVSTLFGSTATRISSQVASASVIAIARALAMQPDVLICDEPVASLDVSIQAQIINLFLELTRDLDLTCVFISHDLSVIQHVSDRVAVMYLGRIVELGPVDQVFAASAHPYTAALFGSVPKLVLDADELVHFDTIEGEVPSPLSPPPGCYYNPRCPRATDICTTTQPETQKVSELRAVACHHFKAVLADKDPDLTMSGP